MDFLVYSRAVPRSELPEYTAEDDERLNERHWSYMDAFADQMAQRLESIADFKLFFAAEEKGPSTGLSRFVFELGRRLHDQIRLREQKH